jgi:hypothetical protein
VTEIDGESAHVRTLFPLREEYPLSPVSTL